ncbi:MAG: winged helix-turn-helix transcriptional regulator [Angelakisella sp.]
MKKSGLRDMKLRNRQVILRAIVESGGLSRIEIAQKTELSPSTVTGLVGELLEEGLLAETGVTVSTAGRNRTELSINGEHGAIAVAEIGRKGASLHIFNMLLEQSASVTLSDSYISGNDLLIAITAAIFDKLGADNVRGGRLAGIGLLFQEDMQAGEFNVVYSTSLSSASITLRDALITQFRVPVTEDYSQLYSLTTACAPECAPNLSSAHIALGDRVLTSITIGGQQLPMHDGRCADITPLLGGLTAPASCLPEAQSEKSLPEKAMPEWTEAMARQLSGILAILCTVFPLDVIYLSGVQERFSGLVPMVKKLLAARIQPVTAPEIKLFRPAENNAATLLATKIRTDLLFA